MVRERLHCTATDREPSNCSAAILQLQLARCIAESQVDLFVVLICVAVLIPREKIIFDTNLPISLATRTRT